MSEIKHLINGRDLGLPRNWKQLEITVDWLNTIDSGSINITDLSFVLKAKEYLKNRIINGMNDGVGIFEGEPYTILVGNPSNPAFKFDGYLDFTDALQQLGNEEITCSLKKRKGEDWLNDVADSFSFASLYDEKLIQKTDFVSVPYVINFKPDGMQLIMLSMSTYMMSKELAEGIRSLADISGYWAFSLTPSVGLGVTYDFGKVVLAILKTALRIAYVVAVVIAIKKLIETLFEEILPKKRKHLGMSFRKLMEVGCAKLGLEFNSSIKELEWIYIPRKNEIGGVKGETGYPTSDGSFYTFGDCIRELKKDFNADYRIVNDVFYLERRDKFEFLSQYKIPDFFNNQERMLNVNGYNTDEMIANYYIVFPTDSQDLNTFDNTGRVFQAVTEPEVTINPEFVNIKGINKVDLSFSLGLDKQGLNRIEKVAKVLGRLVDTLTDVITLGNGSNFANKIEERRGCLLLSSHFLTYGKVVKMSGDRLAKNQRQIINAELLWSKYHFINSFAEVNGVHNQFIKYTDYPVPMHLEEFVSILENNLSSDDIGNDVYIDKLTYNPYNSKALIDFRVRKKYTENLKLRIL